MDKRVIKKEPVEVEGKRFALYTITDAGEHFYTENTGKKHFYRCTRIVKIIALSYFYISMLETCENWKNKDEWYADGENGIIPDATFIQNGEAFGIVVAREDDKARIQEKLTEFSERNNISQIKIMIR